MPSRQLIRNNVRFISLNVLREEGRGYFTVLNLLADTRKNPRSQHFMPLRAASSDLSEKA